MRRLSEEEVVAIARTLEGEGYSRSESVPLMRWRNEDWPDDPFLFRVVDAWIEVVRAGKAYGYNDA